jgi:hypothetical protein
MAAKDSGFLGCDVDLTNPDLDSGHTICSLEGHASSVNAVAVTPDGHRTVSGSVQRERSKLPVDRWISGLHISEVAKLR